MVAIRYANTEYEVEPKETVLDALEKRGVQLPRGCGKGVCHSCMIRIVSGNAPEDAQQGIKATLRAQGYVLACQCRPTANIEIASADDSALFEAATVMEKQQLAEDVFRIYIKPENPFGFRAGQFLNLRRSDGLMRSYSLASLPRPDEYLELHIRRIQGGRMSGYLCDEIAVGDSVEIRGPNGNCFYVEGEPERGLLLIGTGTGLAPLLGIARDAVEARHSGDIHLFHGSRAESGLYLTEAMRTLDAATQNFHFHACLSGEDKPGFESGRADERALAALPDLSNFSVFICGLPEMVYSVKRRAYLAGAKLENINADPFELASN